MSTYLEACLSALQNSDDKRLAGCKFSSLSRGGSYFISVSRSSYSHDDLEFELSRLSRELGCIWFLNCLSLNCGWLASTDTGYVVAVLEILNSVPRGNSDE